MLHSLFKYMNSGIKLFVSVLAVSSMARGGAYDGSKEYKDVYDQAMDGRDVLVPYHENYWFNTNIISNSTYCHMPEIDCTMSTDYVGDSGIRYTPTCPYWSSSIFNPPESSNLLRRGVKAYLKCPPSDCKQSFWREGLTVQNEGCSTVLDKEVCEDTYKHGGPHITVNCIQKKT